MSLESDDMTKPDSFEEAAHRKANASVVLNQLWGNMKREDTTG